MRAQVESVALQLRQLQKSHDWLEGLQAAAKEQSGKGGQWRAFEGARLWERYLFDARRSRCRRRSMAAT